MEAGGTNIWVQELWCGWSLLWQPQLYRSPEREFFWKKYYFIYQNTRGWRCQQGRRKIAWTCTTDQIMHQAVIQICTSNWKKIYKNGIANGLIFVSNQCHCVSTSLSLCAGRASLARLCCWGWTGMMLTLGHHQCGVQQRHVQICISLGLTALLSSTLYYSGLYVTEDPNKKQSLLLQSWMGFSGDQN